MSSLIQENENLLLMLGVLSLISFLVTLAVVPWIIIKLPHDYFSKPRRIAFIARDAHPSIRFVVLIFKNIVGVAVLLLGILMLVIPGQGLLTMLIGLILVDFPGKFKYQKWLISRKPVLKSANWLRKKGDREPLSIA